MTRQAEPALRPGRSNAGSPGPRAPRRLRETLLVLMYLAIALAGAREMWLQVQPTLPPSAMAAPWRRSAAQ